MSQNNKERIIKNIKSFQGLLQFKEDWIPFTGDKEFVIAMVQKNGLLLQKAADELKNDKDVVIEALKESGWALKFVSPELKNNKEIVVMATMIKKHVLQHASEEMQNDRELLLELEKTKDNIPPIYKPWFNERMMVLDILNEDYSMRESIKMSEKKAINKKF